MTTGEKIKKYRKEHKMTQEYLAERMDITRQAISKWESNASLPNMENLIELSNIFDIPLSELTGTRDESNPDSIAILTGISKSFIKKLFVAAALTALAAVLVYVVYFNKNFKAEPTINDKYRINFNGYSGYLDECIGCDLSTYFTSADYDNDGLVDRVYKKLNSNDSCSFEIEFGNGSVLDIGGNLPDSGFPYILSCDFTNDGKTDIVFGISHDDSTDPQAYGEVLFFTKADGGYERLNLPGNDGGSYNNLISFNYEKVANNLLRVICNYTGFETTLKIDKDVWEYYQYDDTLAGKEAEQCIYRVNAKQSYDGSISLLGEIRLVDKWSAGEATIEIIWNDGKLIYGEMYQEAETNEPVNRFIYDVSTISEIEIIDEKTGRSCLIDNDKSDFIDKLNKTKWQKQELSVGIADNSYSVKIFGKDNSLSELDFRNQNILNADGYLWANTEESIPFEDYLPKKPSMYAANGIDDDSAVKFMGRFISDILNDNKKDAAEIIKYPRRIIMPNKELIVHNSDEFLKYYDLIFTSSFKLELESALNEGLDWNYSGAWIGYGEVWLRNYDGYLYIDYISNGEGYSVMYEGETGIQKG